MYTQRKKEKLMPLIRQELIVTFFTKEKGTKYLEVVKKFSTLISSFAIILGSIIVLSYLKSIKHPSIFADTIGSPHSFIAVIAVSITLFLLMHIAFMIPYAILLGKPDIPTKFWEELLSNRIFNRLFFILFLPHAIYIILLICLSIGFLINPNILDSIKTYFKHFLWIATISPLLTLFVYFLKDKSLPLAKKAQNYCAIFFYAFFSSSLGFLFPLYIALYLSQWTSDGLKQYFLLIGYEFAFLFNLFLASFYLSSKNNQKDKKYIFLLPLIPGYILVILLYIFSDNLPFRLLYPIRFIESPNDASWYLLHRNSSEINSADLKKIKSNFACLPSEQQEEKKNPKHTCTEEANQRHNALFGYMAWNLGNVKVFCPTTVKNNIKADEIGDTTNQCLTIDSKALQKMHGEHIGYSRTP